MRRAVLTIAIAISACKSHRDEPATPPPAPSPIAHVADAPAPDARRQPELELVSPGAEPRHVIRYAVPKSTRSTIELAVDTQAGAGEIGTSLPTTVVQLVTTVTDVAADGTMQLRTELAGAHARARAGSKVVAGSLDDRLHALDGLVMTAALAPDGTLDAVHAEPPAHPLPEPTATALGQLLGSYGQLATQLPHQPIGVGATWRTTRQFEQQGIAMTAVTTIELTGIEGTTLMLTAHGELSGADQKVTREGLAIDVTQIRGKSIGAQKVDLATLAILGDLSMQLDTTMSADGVATPMTMTMALSLGPPN